MQLQPHEPLRFAPVGPAQATWQRVPGPPLGQGLGPDAPKKCLLVAGSMKSVVPQLWELGCLYPTLAGSSGDHHTLGFCKPQRGGKSVKGFKKQRGIQTWPENPWI